MRGNYLYVSITTIVILTFFYVNLYDFICGILIFLLGVLIALQFDNVTVSKVSKSLTTKKQKEITYRNELNIAYNQIDNPSLTDYQLDILYRKIENLERLVQLLS